LASNLINRSKFKIMKKVLLVAVLALFGFSVSAQEGFKVGAHVGLPIGDVSDFSSFTVGLDVAYMFETSDSFDVGIASGFVNGFGKSETVSSGGFTVEFDAPDFQYIPLAVAGRFKASEEFSIGADLGYAVGISEGNDGGFYYRPLVGYNISEKAQIQASYSGVSLDGVTWTAINLGVLFSL